MKINLKAKTSESGVMAQEAWVKGSGTKDMLIKLLEQALSVARIGEGDEDVRESVAYSKDKEK